MLDEEHPDLLIPSTDLDTYTLGRSGKHNVVIACLPFGEVEVGNNASSAVASQMVRLGDVVVSVLADGFGGVVQWDFGITEQGGTFKRTGALNGPPKMLRTALTKLTSRHAMQGSMYAHVAEKPDNQSSNSIGADDLNEATVEDNCTFCDRAKVVVRKERGMGIHYGLIASGNQVVKDAGFRDAINLQLGGNVRCFEMEAPGLMNDFPCIVVRGMCDYADSQKQGLAGSCCTSRCRIRKRASLCDNQEQGNGCSTPTNFKTGSTSDKDSCFVQDQSLDDLLANILKQLIQTQSPIPESMKEAYKAHKRGRTRLTSDEMSQLLHDAVADLSKAYIIIDALDECQDTDGCRSKFIEPDARGGTPLSFAVDGQRMLGTNSLIKHHTNLDCQKWSTFFASNWDHDLTKALLNGGADPFLQDCTGKTPISWAAESGDFTIMEILLDHLTCVTLADIRGRTPLPYARESDSCLFCYD
ncbi:hypothetical protein BO71DRAFT_427936 [Aspergillus ellipticus CBS 707.79]|uniref:Nephrocystin 3-like N-terminal domain-containing protein n=1 Tax=Aspergillus ellipticus CBS 707.79 TaxID=1448320 RepID=A0A319DGG1_9EURO|nr:hypothetical protein BO71DRAFT_427936 [Aspergillus ellipticus CBS 707.79]